MLFGDDEDDRITDYDDPDFENENDDEEEENDEEGDSDSKKSEKKKKEKNDYDDPDDEEDENEDEDEEDGDDEKSKKKDKKKSKSDDDGTDDDEDGESDLDDDLVDEAVLLGYSVDDLEGITDNKSLKALINFGKKKLEAAGKDDYTRKEEEEDSDDSDSNSPELDLKIEYPEDFDEKTKEIFDKVIEHVSSHHNKIYNVLVDMINVNQDREAKLALASIDAVIGNLEDYEDLVGKGSHESLTGLKGKRAEANRQKIIDMAAVIESGFIKQGRKVPSERKIVELAAKMAFPEHITKKTVKELSDKSKKFKKNFRNKTEKTSDAKSGNKRQRAIEDLEAGLSTASM